MTEQKFYVGDRVRIRPFCQIDQSDIGNASYTDGYCYGIPRRSIDKWSDKPEGFIVRYVRWTNEKSMFVYELTDPVTGDLAAYCWGQGMLYPYDEYEETDLPDRDPDEMFGFLFSKEETDRV